MAHQSTHPLPWEASDALGLLERYPPPYHLSCDLAVFPLLVDAAQAQHWAGAPLMGALGHTPFFLVAARYHHATYGPEATLLTPAPDHPYLYQEIACVLLSGILPGFSFVTPRLWVDAADRLPLELGWSYGFPKVAGNIQIRRSRQILKITAADEQGPILAATCALGIPVPPLLITLLAQGDGLFPHRGLRAKMHLEGAVSATLVVVKKWELPRLGQWGVGGRAAFGFWLEKAMLVLAPPRKLWPKQG